MEDVRLFLVRLGRQADPLGARLVEREALESRKAEPPAIERRYRVDPDPVEVVGPGLEQRYRVRRD
jgi:hypothetical protein